MIQVSRIHYRCFTLFRDPQARVRPWCLDSLEFFPRQSCMLLLHAGVPEKPCSTAWFELFCPFSSCRSCTRRQFFWCWMHLWLVFRFVTRPKNFVGTTPENDRRRKIEVCFSLVVWKPVLSTFVPPPECLANRCSILKNIAANFESKFFFFIFSLSAEQGNDTWERGVNENSQLSLKLICPQKEPKRGGTRWSNRFKAAWVAFFCRRWSKTISPSQSFTQTCCDSYLRNCDAVEGLVGHHPS